MNLELLEAAAWQAAGEPTPSRVAQAVSALRAWYVARDPRVRIDSAAEALAKLAFYGVVDAPKLTFVMNELAAAGALPGAPRWRVLDVGAGGGSTTLALAEWLRESGRETALDATGLDLDGQALRTAPRLLAAWKALARASTPTVAWHGVVADVTRAPLPPAPFDLILCSNALNEVARSAEEPSDAVLSLVRRLAQSLAPSGTLILLEPALREPSRALHRVRDALIADGELTVFAPCTRTDAPCPMLAKPRDWCHEERRVPLPDRVQLVARLAGINRYTLKYAYLVLRRAGTRLADVQPALTHRVVSAKLVSKGRDEIFLCGETGLLRVLRNRRDASTTNAAFADLDRGQLVLINPLEPSRPRVVSTALVHAWDAGSERLQRAEAISGVPSSPLADCSPPFEPPEPS